MEHIVTFSGGKDSQATMIWCKENLDKDFKVVFCDTKWESKQTYKFILEFMAEFGKELIVLESKKYNGMVDMVKRKKRFPSATRRFCTAELKVIPMIDYLLDEVGKDFTVYQGIRHQESRNRAEMNRVDDYFKGYYEPIRTIDLKAKLAEYESEPILFGDHPNQKQIDKIKKKLKKGVEYEYRYFTYRKKEVLEFVKEHEHTVVRPIITWTAHQVIKYIIDSGHKYNPLYDMGFSRVGCLPCIMCRLGEVALMAEHKMEEIENLSKIEKELGATFFPPDYIPERFCSKIVTKGSKNKKVPTIEDVVKYVKKNNHAVLGGMVSCKNPFVVCE